MRRNLRKLREIKNSKRKRRRRQINIGKLKNRAAMITWISNIRADKSKSNFVSEKFMESIEKRSVEIVEIEDVLLHQNHRSFHLRLRISAAGEQIHQIADHLWKFEVEGFTLISYSLTEF